MLQNAQSNVEGFVVNELRSGGRPQIHVRGPLGQKVDQLSSESRERSAAKYSVAKEKAERDVMACLGSPGGDRLVTSAPSTRPPQPSTRPAGTQRRTRGVLLGKLDGISDKAAMAEEKQGVKAKLKRDVKAKKEAQKDAKMAVKVKAMVKNGLKMRRTKTRRKNEAGDRKNQLLMGNFR